MDGPEFLENMDSRPPTERPESPPTNRARTGLTSPPINRSPHAAKTSACLSILTCEEILRAQQELSPTNGVPSDSLRPSERVHLSHTSNRHNLHSHWPPSMQLSGRTAGNMQRDELQERNEGATKVCDQPLFTSHKGPYEKNHNPLGDVGEFLSFPSSATILGRTPFARSGLSRHTPRH